MAPAPVVERVEFFSSSGHLSNGTPVGASNGFEPYVKEGLYEPDVIEPIAVIGLSMKFPQSITSPDALWETLAAKKSAMTEFPQSRLNIDAFYDPDTERLNGVGIQLKNTCGLSV